MNRSRYTPQGQSMNDFYVSLECLGSFTPSKPLLEDRIQAFLDEHDAERECPRCGCLPRDNCGCEVERA